MYKRIIHLKGLKPTQGHPASFFLWGPRQTGKSSLLRSEFSEALYIDLLQTDVWSRLSTHPSKLRDWVEGSASKGKSFTIIDEVQKIPSLLDEVHWLIENKKKTFILCGSSARKLKRGHANLLGGRAIRKELWGLTCEELGDDFDLLQILNRGTLPSIYVSDLYSDLLRSYCGDYLKEEIMAEGLVRNLPAFSGFLEAAALSDTEVLQFQTIARDVGVSSPTVKSYFELLEDTLIGKTLQPYRKRPKRRIQITPKFYFFDVGIVNHLAKRKLIELKSEAIGKAFENWVFHELQCHRSYRNPDLELSYWRLSSGIEVDFILNDLEAAIEVKAVTRVHSDHLKGLRELAKEHPQCGRRIVVSLEAHSSRTEDGIEIMNYREFLEQLGKGEII